VEFDPRVIVGEANDLERLTRGIPELGCTFEGAWSKLISVDVPPGVELEDVRSFLTSGKFEWEHADPTMKSCLERRNEGPQNNERTRAA
jgi:hypothetical protein